MVLTTCPIIGEQVAVNFVAQYKKKFLKILRSGFRATLNFQKFKVALHPLCRIFLNFAKKVASYHADYNLITKKGVNELVFELYELKAKIKGVFSRSYCFFGSLLSHKINSNFIHQ